MTDPSRSVVAGAPTRPRHGGTVLLVEDNEADAALVTAHLCALPAMPWAIVHRSTAAEAVEHVTAHPETACVLLDLGLPDAEGLEALLALTDLEERPPIIVLTGHDDGRTPIAALRHGADDYLIKDAVDGAGLMRAIHYAIERRGVLDHLAARELFVRTVLDTFDASIAVLDRHGRIIDVNAGWLRYAIDNDADPGAVGIGADYLAVCERAVGDDRAGALRAGAGIRAVLDGTQDRFQLHYDASHGEEEDWRSLRVTRLPDPGGGAVVFHLPITDLKRTEAELQHLATHDPLTGLPNRAYLLDRLSLAAEGARYAPESLAVLFIDLDDFKLINDSYGHAVGDEALVAVSRLLRRAVRDGDLVARFGGDEFVVLCERLTSTEQAEVLAERIFQALAAAPLHIAGRPVHLTASIGIATGEDAALDPAHLLQDADTAMYHAKRRGRSRHARFDRSLRDRSRDRLEEVEALRGALERDELSLHYQPQVALATGRAYGLEALLRWESAGGMRDTPSVVLLAEQTGLMPQLGGWVLERALRDASRAPAHLSVAINVSAHQLDGGLVELAGQGLRRHRLDPQRICIELTETAAMADLDQAVGVLGELRGLGVRIALDDFGTGHATLAQLQRLPVDSLKIDRSFVDGLDLEEPDTRIARAVVQLGQAFDLEVVAEGIEDARQIVALRGMGCERGQGFLCGRPAPMEVLAGAGL